MHLKKTCFDKWRRHTAIHSLMWPGLLRPTIHRPRWNKAMLFLLDFANIIQKLKIWFWITQNSNFFHKARAGYKFDSIISTLYFVKRMHSCIKPKHQIIFRSSHTNNKYESRIFTTKLLFINEMKVLVEIELSHKLPIELIILRRLKTPCLVRKLIK